jgi:hypothetical protein
MDDPELGVRLAANARRLAEEEYSLEAVACRMASDTKSGV